MIDNDQLTEEKEETCVVEDASTSCHASEEKCDETSKAQPTDLMQKLFDSLMHEVLAIRYSVHVLEKTVSLLSPNLTEQKEKEFHWDAVKHLTSRYPKALQPLEEQPNYFEEGKEILEMLYPTNKDNAVE